jgi:hypothetical protein
MRVPRRARGSEVVVRTPWLAAAVLSAAVLADRVLVRAEDAPPNSTPPPTTALPDFEDPIGDAEVGETCFFRVKGKDDRSRWYEERILARTATRVLVETVMTDAKDEKAFQTIATASGWRPGKKTFPTDLPKGTTWKTDLQKDEVVYVGPEDAPKGVRCTKRVLEEPVDPSNPDGPKRQREIWYSHDVAARGVAKMLPAAPFGAGERRAISWSKRLTGAECAKLLAAYPTAEEDAKANDASSSAAMDDPGMDDGGMKEPPAMDDPSMG